MRRKAKRASRLGFSGGCKNAVWLAAEAPQRVSGLVLVAPLPTKVWNDDVRANRVNDAFEQSLDQLGLEYLDLYLVHWPITGKIVTAWRAMQQLARSGRVKAIGVSKT